MAKNHSRPSEAAKATSTSQTSLPLAKEDTTYAMIKELLHRQLLRVVKRMAYILRIVNLHTLNLKMITKTTRSALLRPFFT